MGLVCPKVGRMMTDLIYPAVLVMVSALALLAILHPAFDDNVLQRFGLAAICFGAVVRSMTLLGGQDLEGPRDIIVYGVLLYALGTLRSYWHGRRRRGDRRHSRHTPPDCPFWEIEK